jgi:hypothetical protein
MCRQPAVKNRPAFLAGTVLRISVTACIFLASSHFGATVGARGDEQVVSPLGQFEPWRSDVCRENPFPGTFTIPSLRVPADETCVFVRNASVPPGAARATSSPLLSNCRSTPLTEGLSEVRPTPIRVEVRRWGIAVFASGSKASQCGRPPNRRSACRTPRLALPSRSLQELFCLWVI